MASLAAAITWATAAAQMPPPSRGGTYVEPPPADPLYLPPGPNQRREVAAPDDGIGLSLRLAVDYPLRTNVQAAVGRGTQGSPPVSPTLQATLRYVPVRDSYWFVQSTFVRYLMPGRQQPWNPDFTYVFGYDDWHPGTWSLTYANYAGNRFDPDPREREKRWNFANGTWSIGYKDQLPEALEPLFLVGNGDQVGCAVNLNRTARYTDLRTLSFQRNKLTVSSGCRYAMANNFYFNFTLIGYLRRSQQQPWDPDFTWGFGYFDWRPGTISVQYNNYSGNRFPGHARAPNQGTFRNGSISLSWSTQW
jgi:hypothetical protein